MRITRDVELVACLSVGRVVAVTPETGLDDPADEDYNGDCESVDGVEVCQKKACGVDEGVNKADEWEESGIEDEPAAGLVNREVTRFQAEARGKTQAKNWSYKTSNVKSARGSLTQ